MRLYSRLFKYIRPYFLQIAGGSICITLVTATTLLIAPLAGYIFKLIGDKEVTMFNLAAIGMVCLFFVKGIFLYGQEYLAAYVAQKTIFNLRTKLYEHIQDLSMDFFSKWHTGELISRVMNDIQTLQMTLHTAFTALVPHSLLLVGLVGYIFWLNWKLSLLTMVAFPLIVQVIRLFAREIREISEGVQQKAADITSHLQETISQIRTVKSFTMEKKEVEKFRSESDKSFSLSMRAMQILATQNPVIALLQAIAVVAVVWFGGMEIIRGNLSLPQLISFATALAIMTDPGSTLSKNYTLLQQGMASVKRIFEVFDIQPTIQDEKHAKELKKINGKVAFQDISFAYENEEVLKGIDLTVEPGEAVALVGRTGAGKSTLASLLLRFYDPNTGHILIDGQDIKKVKIESLRKQIAVVPQEITLFSGTIRDNIAYGKPAAKIEEIISAAKQANAHAFIEKLPKGYDTMAGERGTKLSGGERQRIAIARAILRDPRILILDEATSSLDAETEALIREALDRLMKGRTSFIIAHRLYTVEKVSRIVVIDAGKIVEVGPHAELLKKDGLYKRLYEIQFKNVA